MKKISITTPDGKTISLNAPDGASADQIKAYAAKAVSVYKQKMAPQAEAVTPQAPKEKGMLGKTWDAIGVPAQKSREGLEGITEIGKNMQNLAASKTGLPIGTEPTGNLARDVVANVPRIAGETLSEVAPSFVDKASILTAGAGAGIKAAGKAAGAGIKNFGGMLERGSGLGKGTLEAAYKDPKMIMDFGGKLKASKIYDELKSGATIPTHLKTNAKVVSDAMNQMSKGNWLTAPDAFKARKAVNALMRNKSAKYPMDDLIETKKALEEMVFSSVKEADKMYVRAIRGEQMRNISRLNKNGTTGPLSAAVMAKIPALTPLISPAFQGIAASASGAAAQMAPQTIMNSAAMVGAGLDRLKNRKEKSRGKH